jgi:hypothetical protein
MESVLTPMKAASSLIDRFFAFMRSPWFNVLSHPTPEILPWELGRCMLMYPLVRSSAHFIAFRCSSLHPLGVITSVGQSGGEGN